MKKWLPLPGYEGIYEIGDNGQVKALARVTERNGRPYRKKERILKPGVHTGGYHFVILYTGDGEHEQRYVHRLVMQTFCPVDNGLQVNHKNLDKTDNRLENLEWVTPGENQGHARGRGRFHGRTNARFHRKLTPAQVDQILIAPGSSEEVAAQFGVSGSMILHIRNGRRWVQP